MVSPFDVLEIDDDADEDAIERAYRDRVKEAHPDRGGTLEEFQLVRRAYRTLTDPDRRDGANGDRRDAADVDLTDDESTSVGPARVEFLDYEVLADRGWSIDDDDLFTKASHADLGAADYGRLLVEPDESLLEGELSQPANTILSDDHSERGFRLSCNGYPVSDELKVVFNVKHLPDLDELRLPPGPFRRAHSK